MRTMSRTKGKRGYLVFNEEAVPHPRAASGGIVHEARFDSQFDALGFAEVLTKRGYKEIDAWRRPWPRSFLIDYRSMCVLVRWNEGSLETL